MLLTVTEVAAELKTSKGYVYKLLNAGLIPFIVLGAKKVRRESLERFCEEYEGKDIDEIMKGLEQNED